MKTCGKTFVIVASTRLAFNKLNASLTKTFTDFLFGVHLLNLVMKHATSYIETILSEIFQS